MVGGITLTGAGVDGVNEGMEGLKDWLVEFSACDAGDLPFCMERAGGVCGIEEQTTGDESGLSSQLGLLRLHVFVILVFQSRFSGRGITYLGMSMVKPGRRRSSKGTLAIQASDVLLPRPSLLWCYRTKTKLVESFVLVRLIRPLKVLAPIDVVLLRFQSLVT